jgi:hypothetical protein
VIEGEGVNHLFAPTVGLNESTVTQAGKVRAHARLRLRRCLNELGHCTWPVPQDLEDAQSSGVAEDSKEPSGGCCVRKTRWVRDHIRKTGYHPSGEASFDNVVVDFADALERGTARPSRAASITQEERAGHPPVIHPDHARR